MEDSEKYLMVAALDFGTTYSGYAFSMRSDFLKQPLDIQANPVWKAGSQKFMSLKTPTCLLLDSKQEFVAFGFDAEDQWTDLLYEEEHEEYYFFERFKMNLHNNKAGIPKDNLFLALEPETASIFCQYLSTEKLKGSEPGFTMTSEGTEYMVVDLGGGTADITVHKKVANGRLKEKHRAIGNDCGGTSIDKRFFEVFEEIFGNTIINLLKKECPIAYLDLVREFESQKRAVETSNKTKVTMAIPFVALDEMCQKSLQKNLKSLLENSPYSKEIMLTKGGKIRISVDFFKTFFMPSIEGVISLMREIFRNKSLKNVAHVLIVGGFSECKLMQDAVRNAFPDQRIINPNEAGLSVLKGAVLFGHKPDYIQSRVMRCSYGVKTNLPWNEKKYDRKHHVLMEGEERCDNIFSLIVEKNESVEAGMIVKNLSLHLSKTRSVWTLWCMYPKRQQHQVMSMIRVTCFVNQQSPL
ncbi:unnamed protein product [Mytilus edulis]|uniref:Heat shock 70 kDa protein 12A n=1 Tax=Mytilus edulis TaxID=6550 RepID=A0A8S3R0T0_MYTED|nr:unnamed protein product [Mytilus edulis]